MEDKSLEKPCLVEAGRGFSVSYKGRFLYSKYSPERAVLGAVDSLEILPNTLILACSPVLWLGLPPLLEKVDESCFILGVEFDKNLHDLAKIELEKLKTDSLQKTSPFTEQVCLKMAKNVALLPFELNDYIVNILTEESLPRFAQDEIRIPHISIFRRAIPFEMSAGTQFHKEKYFNIAALAQNTVASFWKNRITLTRLGRVYSRNLFKNLSNLPSSIDFKEKMRTISKPIFVFGAGESIEETIKKIGKTQIEKCFVIAVDAVSPALKTKEIRIGAIIAVEGQLAIEKAYIGGAAKTSLLIADITSRNQVTRHSQNISFFASKYTDANFFKNLSQKDFFPPVIPPLGSVGLTAVYISLLLRENAAVPVFVSGLDFSFSLGRTHAKSTPAHIARLTASNRLTPVENYAAAFRNGAKQTIGKNGIKIFTDTALEGYARSFADIFKDIQNLYDAGKQGLPIGLPEISSEKLKAYLETVEKNSDISEARPTDSHKEAAYKSIKDFLENEENALNRIKELLMFGNDVASCSMSLEEELQSLIAPREYLFLHFPDGYKCNTSDLSFLKRVRSQIDFFLKDIKHSLVTLPSL